MNNYFNNAPHKTLPFRGLGGRAFDNINFMHGAISYGHIGADLISLASMLSIPVCMHNVEDEKIFRPSAWAHLAPMQKEVITGRARRMGRFIGK